MQLGFVGLGRMGRAMAERLLAAGHEVCVYNRNPEPAEALRVLGAQVCASPSDAASSGVVLSMLANDDVLVKLTRGSDGILAGLPADGIHIAMGTHGTVTIEELVAEHSQQGRHLVSAPVLGRPEAVVAGTLGIVVGGSDQIVEQCLPALQAIGARIVRAGESPAAATAMKVANNFLLGCAIEAMAEAFSLVEKFGAEPKLFYEVISEGLFSAPAYKVYGKLISEKNYANPGFTAVLGLKDANLALSAGEHVGVPLPSANVWRDQLISAIANGDGELDWAVMARQQARNSGF